MTSEVARLEGADIDMSQIPFRAYASDCLVEAKIGLPDGVRLTDYLNESDEVALTDVRLTALEDGRNVGAAELVISPAEIHAIQATDEGLQTQHRIRTRSSGADIVLGPYRVQGYIHGPTAGDPLAMISRRHAMVPVTDAKIAFVIAGEVRVDECDALIVNRLLADISAAQREGPSILDRLGLSPVDPNAKDLTGELSVKPKEAHEEP